MGFPSALFRALPALVSVARVLDIHLSDGRTLPILAGE
jgi:hypothetical protein